MWPKFNDLKIIQIHSKLWAFKNFFFWPRNITSHLSCQDFMVSFRNSSCLPEIFKSFGVLCGFYTTVYLVNHFSSKFNSRCLLHPPWGPAELHRLLDSSAPVSPSLSPGLSPAPRLDLPTYRQDYFPPSAVKDKPKETLVARDTWAGIDFWRCVLLPSPLLSAETAPLVGDVGSDLQGSPCTVSANPPRCSSAWSSGRTNPCRAPVGGKKTCNLFN